MFQEGDVVEIPLPDERTAIGRIMHISQHTQGAMGFIVFGIKGQMRNQHLDVNLTLDVLGPMYTDIDAAKKYGWKTIQHVPLKQRDRQITRRRIGEGVYVGDQFLGSIDELGECDLKPMLLYGMIAVYNTIQRAFGDDEKRKGSS
jgi:hypothetical protein